MLNSVVHVLHNSMALISVGFYGPPIKTFMFLIILSANYSKAITRPSDRHKKSVFNDF